MTEPKLLLRIEDVAQRLSIGRTKVYELMRAGVLPTVHLGRSVRIPLADLEAWVRDEVQAEVSHPAERSGLKD